MRDGSPHSSDGVTVGGSAIGRDGQYPKSFTMQAKGTESTAEDHLVGLPPRSATAGDVRRWFGLWLTAMLARTANILAANWKYRIQHATSSSRKHDDDIRRTDPAIRDGPGCCDQHRGLRKLHPVTVTQRQSAGVNGYGVTDDKQAKPRKLTEKHCDLEHPGSRPSKQCETSRGQHSLARKVWLVLSFTGLLGNAQQLSAGNRDVGRW